MIVIDLLWVVAVTARNQDPFAWQVNLVHVTHQYLDLMEQFPKRIYDICDLKIACCDFVKHRREQEKVIATNEGNLHRAFSCQQFLEMHGGIDATETAAQNDDSLLAQRTSYPNDH